MSKRTFKYSESAMDRLAESVRKTSKGIKSLISDMQDKTDAQLQGWSERSESRQAQLNLDEGVGDRTGELTNALDEAAKALDEINEMAHEAEVRNVAVLN